MMTQEERQVIRRFAAAPFPNGFEEQIFYNKLKESALGIHRAHLDDLESLEQQFMSEVDSPCPDLLLRSMLRKRVAELLPYPAD